MTTPKVRLQKWRHKATFASYMIIRAVVCNLYPVFTLHFTFQKCASFSHAERGKDVVERGLGRDALYARGVAEGVEDHA